MPPPESERVKSPQKRFASAGERKRSPALPQRSRRRLEPQYSFTPQHSVVKPPPSARTVTRLPAGTFI